MATLLHHPMTSEMFEGRTSWWRGLTCGSKPTRCSKCWLRIWECFCNDLAFKIESLEQSVALTNLKSSVEVVVYLHPVEIGRSINTGHVLALSMPSICSVRVYGNEEDDSTFLKVLRSIKCAEYVGILYPCAESVCLDQWMNSQTTESSQNIPGEERTSEKVVLICLDGTYSQASRLARFLSVQLQPSPTSRCAFVHLDLSEQGIRSAMAGIMYQPAKNKICSFQAVAIALQQLFHCNKLTEELLSLLDNWIEHLIRRQIKYGKISDKRLIEGVDNTPAPFVQQLIVSPPFSLLLFCCETNNIHLCGRQVTNILMITSGNI